MDSLARMACHTHAVACRIHSFTGCSMPWITWQETVGCAQGRLVMELHAMMAYGAAAPSVQLLWRLSLLDIILPQHANYLASQGYELGCSFCCGLCNHLLVLAPNMLHARSCGLFSPQCLSLLHSRSCGLSSPPCPTMLHTQS